MAAPRPTSPIDPQRRRRTLLFGAYAVLLTVGLLWPALQIPEVVHRPDLIVHGVAFGLFTGLLYGALKTPRRARGAALALAALGGGAFGGITELLQGLPAIRRTSAWDDFYADLFGVALGVLGAWLAAARGRRARRGNL